MELILFIPSAAVVCLSWEWGKDSKEYYLCLHQKRPFIDLLQGPVNSPIQFPLKLINSHLVQEVKLPACHLVKDWPSKIPETIKTHVSILLHILANVDLAICRSCYYKPGHLHHFKPFWSFENHCPKTEKDYRFWTFQTCWSLKTNTCKYREQNSEKNQTQILSYF